MNAATAAPGGGPGRIHHVLAEHDTNGARTIGRANNPDAGIIATRAAPDLRRRFELGWDLLECFGVRNDLTGAGRDDDASWDALISWLLAYRIRHVVLLDAQWLPRPLLDEVAALAALCGLELWLVAHHPVSTEHLDAIARWPHDTPPPAQLVGVVRAGLDTGRDPTPPLGFPAVPRDNFFTFRAEARRRLDPAAYAVVDERYRQAFTAAAKHVAAITVDEASVLEYLRGELNRCASTDEMFTVVRATQAAAFHAGWLVNADVVRLVVTAETASRAAIHDPDTWRRLRGYRDPYRGAACGFAAADIAITEMQAVTLADVAHDGATATVARDGSTVTVELPAGSRVFVRAQRVHRVNQDAEDTDLLFADQDEPMRDRFLVNALRAPILEIGVPLLSQATNWTRVDSKRWATRWGLSVQEL